MNQNQKQMLYTYTYTNIALNFILRYLLILFITLSVLLLLSNTLSRMCYLYVLKKLPT